MKILTPLMAAAGLLALALPAGAACTGHATTAEAPATSIVTAERKADSPKPAEPTVATPAPNAPADQRG